MMLIEIVPGVFCCAVVFAETNTMLETLNIYLVIIMILLVLLMFWIEWLRIVKCHNYNEPLAPPFNWVAKVKSRSHRL